MIVKTYESKSLAIKSSEIGIVENVSFIHPHFVLWQ